MEEENQGENIPEGKEIAISTRNTREGGAKGQGFGSSGEDKLKNLTQPSMLSFGSLSLFLVYMPEELSAALHLLRTPKHLENVNGSQNARSRLSEPVPLVRT